MAYGIGRIGKIEEQTFSDFALKVKEKFHLDSVRLVAYGIKRLSLTVLRFVAEVVKDLS